MPLFVLLHADHCPRSTVDVDVDVEVDDNDDDDGTAAIEIDIDIEVGEGLEIVGAMVVLVLLVVLVVLVVVEEEEEERGDGWIAARPMPAVTVKEIEEGRLDGVAFLCGVVVADVDVDIAAGANTAVESVVGAGTAEVAIVVVEEDGEGEVDGTARGAIVVSAAFSVLR